MNSFQESHVHLSTCRMRSLIAAILYSSMRLTMGITIVVKDLSRFGRTKFLPQISVNFRDGISVFIRTREGEHASYFRVGVAAIILRIGSIHLLRFDVLAAFNSCVGWLRLVIGNSPSVADLHRTRYAILVAQNLYAPRRDTPPFGGLRDRKIFHDAPSRYCPLGLFAKR